MVEYLDIYDEEGRHIGREKRSVVHEKGYIHKTVMFFLLDKEGKVFVNQRTQNKDFYPGYWSIVFGGHVPAGETHDMAIVREAKEETGVEEKPIFITSYRKRHDREDRENSKVYAFIVDKELDLDPDEIKHGKFVTLEELEDIMKKEKFLPETKDMYRILREYLGE